MKNRSFCLAYVAASLVALAALAGFAAYWGFSSDRLPEASLDAPSSAVVGTPFEIEIDVSNPFDRALVLDSIDVDDSLLGGFQVLSVDPLPIDSFPIPFLDQQSWSFSRRLSAGETQTVTFTLEPLRAGTFAGNFDLCNTAQDWIELPVEIVVEDSDRRRP